MRKLAFILILALILCGGCAPKSLITLRIPDTDVDIMMKLIPAGNFVMGSPSLEQDRWDDEGPQHLVTITEPFYMGVFEVTQEQWLAVMETLPSEFGYIPGNPVERVSWDDCQDFITELNTLGIGTFRLPTEAEWEYACRADTITTFPWGADLTYGSLGEYAWYDDNSDDTTHLVGGKLPNQWGLYDMHGNVFEWCKDLYGEYGIDPQTDPQGSTTGWSRVIRGGCMISPPDYCRSASRGNVTPTIGGNWIGFRLVRMAP